MGRWTRICRWWTWRGCRAWGRRWKRARCLSGCPPVRRANHEASREDAVFIIFQDLIGRASSLLRAPFHEALEVNRAVFTREMDLTLTRFFVAAEERILSDEPARVAAEKIGISRRIAQGGCAVVVSGSSRPDFVQLIEKSACEIGRAHV